MADKKYNILLTASDNTREAFESASVNIEKMTGGLINLQGLLAGASVGAVVEMVKSTTDMADQMGKAAQKVGTTTEALSQLKYAAELSDVPFEALQKGLEKLSKAAYDATTIGGATAQSFKQMGIATTDSSGHLKDSSAMMSEVADKFSHMKDGSAKTALAMALFGKAGAEMIPLLNEGSAGLKEMADEADNLGVTISTSTSKDAEKFNDNMTRLAKAAEGAALSFTARLLPSLSDTSEAMVDFTKKGEPLLALLRGLGGVAKLPWDLYFPPAAIENSANRIRELKGELGDLERQGQGANGKLVQWLFGSDEDRQHKMDIIKNQIAVIEAHAKDLDKSFQPALKPSGVDTTIDNTKAIAALDRLLAASKVFDEQSNVAHEDGFNRWLTNWKKIEGELTAEGAKGTKARLAHEAAYTVYVNAENEKRLTDAGKIEAAKAKQLTAELLKEADYYARLKTMADDATGTATVREKKRYDLQLKDLEKHHKDTVKAIGNNHALLLAEEEAYQVALGNIKAIHQAADLQSDETVAAMARAFSTENKTEEITSTLGYFEKLSSYGASHHRAMFEINKRASEASALVNTYLAATKALAELGPILGPTMAVAITALGMAQVDAIESTQFGGGSASAGGGGIPSMSTSPGIPVAPSYSAPPGSMPIAAQSPQQINLTIVGAAANPDAPLISYNTFVNDFIPIMKQAKDNGHLVDFNVTMG